jgi:hypothetical protein
MVEDVFNKKGVIEPDSDYQLARRFVDRLENKDLVETGTQKGDLLWVNPKPELVLERS